MWQITRPAAIALFLAWPAGSNANDMGAILLPSEHFVVAAGYGRSSNGPPSPPPPGDPRTLRCDSFLPNPSSAVANPGATIFWYTLAMDGTVHDVSLYRSSGNKDLDGAALACAAASRRPPAIVGGNYLDVMWVGAMNWGGISHNFYDPTPDGNRNHCTFSYPSYAIRRHHEGTVVVKFEVGADGRAKDSVVEQSSGHSELDDTALSCAQTFAYFPVLRNRQPVEIERALRIDYVMYGAWPF